MIKTTTTTVSPAAAMRAERVARDLIAGELLAAARKIGTDRFGNGPSLAAVEAEIGRSSDRITSVFFALCMAGEWPGSRPRRSRFA